MLWRCWFRVPCPLAGSVKACHPRQTSKMTSIRHCWVACFRRSLALKVNPGSTRRKHGGWVACFRRSFGAAVNPGPTRRKHGAAITPNMENSRPWHCDMLWRCWFRVPCPIGRPAKACHTRCQSMPPTPNQQNDISPSLLGGMLGGMLGGTLSPILWRDSEPCTNTAKAWGGYNP